MMHIQISFTPQCKTEITTTLRFMNVIPSTST